MIDDGRCLNLGEGPVNPPPGRVVSRYRPGITEKRDVALSCRTDCWARDTSPITQPCGHWVFRKMQLKTTSLEPLLGLPRIPVPEQQMPNRHGENAAAAPNDQMEKRNHESRHGTHMGRRKYGAHNGVGGIMAPAGGRRNYYINYVNV